MQDRASRFSPIDTARSSHGSALACLLCLLAALALLPTPAQASGARQGVKAKPGEIVLLRDVSARHAVRQAPPGMALIVDPSPASEINAMLGTGEISDEEFAAMDSGVSGPAQGVMVERVVTGALDGSLGGSAAGSGAVSGNGISQWISGPMGAVGSATRGVGDHIRGALSQMPTVPTLPTTPVGPPGG